jgi:3-oxoacyl-ACP reductase-like protein
MGIFDAIKNAIWKHPAASPSASTASAATTAAAAAPAAAPIAAAPAALPTSTAGVDIGAVLTAMEAKSGQKLNWQTSIVDLMKLVGLDSSLQNRKQLAAELGYTGDTNDSASMNIWLHKQVMSKLEESGGQLPDSLKQH